MERQVVEGAETIQASDKCYACRRGLECLFDFPVVKVTGFKRIQVPTDLVLPRDRGVIFVDPDNKSIKSINWEVPKEVKALFDDDTVVKEQKLSDFMTVDLVNFEGYQWGRQRFGKGGESLYHRAKILPGGGDLIRPVVEPFLSKLEGLVGQEIATADLKPPAVTFDFSSEAGLILSSKPLHFQEDDYQDTQRRVDLHIYSHVDCRSIAKIGELSYEGRVYA